MTSSLTSDEHEDGELLELIDRLNLRDTESSRRTPPHTPPRTPPPPARTPVRTAPQTTYRTLPPPYVDGHALGNTSPHISPISSGTVARLNPLLPSSDTVYRFQSPSISGSTREWSIAGNATQGVPGGRVYVVQSPSKKRGPKKAVFVVFCGTRYGVFLTWRETEPLVSGVRNCIFRGYWTLREAEAAFAYAHARGWTRVADPNSVSVIPVLPQPDASAAGDNPLNGDNDTHDDRWFVVYSGIAPGVYRSHLECQLNTLGVRGALHESITGKSAALAKFEAAKLLHNFLSAISTILSPITVNNLCTVLSTPSLLQTSK
ncbi:hypothetical protein C8R43DRAFT_1126344 [Mycena crocata]|nr:hypothetical protein C8R43DRAFT_1126344 [Mycena crocata]